MSRIGRPPLCSLMVREVGEHLRGVPLVGQAVPDRYVGVLGEFLDVVCALPRYSMPS